MLTRILALLAIFCCASAFAETAFYVAGNGNDQWTGKLNAPNAARTDGPFASLERARAAVRALKATGEFAGPVSVLVRGGVHPLAKTFVLGSEDSGTQMFPVTYRSSPGETAVLSGGKAIKGWKKLPGGIYVADLAAQGFEYFRFHELFFKGERQVLARFPNYDPQHPVTGGLLYVDETASLSRNSFHYKEGTIPFAKWPSLAQAEVNIFPYHCWDHNIIRIAKVDPDLNLVTLRNNVAGDIQVGNRYFIQNVFEALDAPGEWYSDYSTGKLYFYPPNGTAPGDTDVAVPALENLVELSGTADNPVRNVRLQDLSLKWARQDAITLEGARDCQIIGNTITQVGGVGVNVGYLRNAMRGVGLPWRKPGLVTNPYHSGDRALQFSYPCEGCRIAGNDVSFVGGDGVVLRGKANVADNNHVYRTGMYDMVCAGMTVCGESNTLSHNAIHDIPRDGIFINGKLNIAEYNDIRNSMLYTADNAAIALRQHDVSQAVQTRGNVLRYNRLLDTVGYGSYPHCTHPGDGFGSPFCSFGIYLDGSICGVTVYGNIIARTGASSVFIQFGGDNAIENNIFVESDEKRIQYDSMIFFGTFMYSDTGNKFKPQEPPNRINHNIFYYGSPVTALYREGHWDAAAWDPRQAQFDDNVIWHKGQPVAIDMDAKLNFNTLAPWLAAGHDTRSLVADPLFMDAKRDDYRLKPDSPAYKVGFKDMNAEIAKIGPYQSGERAVWPLRNAVLDREKPVVFPFVKEAIAYVDGFERSPVGSQPAKAHVAVTGSTAVQVSSEVARDGQHSLKFMDAADATNPWEPHVFYNPSYKLGKVHFSIDIMNSKDVPADYYMEFRDWAGPLYVGPSFRATSDGKFLVNDLMGGGGKEIAQVPNGAWYSVAMDFELGDKAPKEYTLALSVPGKPDLVTKLPYADLNFRNATWFGISSTSTKRAVFYVDNLIIGPADSERIVNARSAPAIKGTGKMMPEPRIALTDPDRLVGYWKLDEDAGNVMDSSGNALNGEGGETMRAQGGFGRALYLDGNGGAAEVPDGPLLQFGTDDLAIECWVYPVTLDIASQHKRRRLIEKGGWPASYWNVDIWSDGRVQMEMADEAVKNGTTMSTGSLPEKKWTHLAIVVDRKHLKTRYYFNGKLDSEQPIPPKFAGALNVPGKAFSTGTWQGFVGMLRDLRLYRRTLTDAEVAGTYEKETGAFGSTAYSVIGEE